VEERGVWHTHYDGRRHRHFSAGVPELRIPDADGREQHTHGTLTFGVPADGSVSAARESSGPVVSTDEEGS